MKKFLVTVIALSALFWMGCGGDDDSGGNNDNTVTVTADTMTAPAIPLVYDDPVWDNVAATSITLSTAAPLPAPPVKSPFGPDKSLAAPSSVDVQAIKKDGRLYLRFQWTDSDMSMKREQWVLFDIDNFNFTHRTDLGEDQVVIMFEGDADCGWDLWNWRLLTTGYQNRAEDGTILNSDITWDNGPNRVASENSTNDPLRPLWFPSSEWEFIGDIMLKSERVSFNTVYPNRNNWTVGQTVPGWYINDDVDWSTNTESRWEITTAHHYDEATNQYTLVMSRTLAGQDDDLDLSVPDRVKAKVGVLDDHTDFDPGSSERAFSADFWLDLP